MQSAQKPSSYLEQRFVFLKLKNEFINDVKEFRKKWEIKRTEIKNQKDKKSWENRLEKWDSEEKIKLMKNPNSTEKDAFLLPNYLFSYELNNLSKKYRFSKNNEEFLRNYVFFNDFYGDNPLKNYIDDTPKVRLSTQSEFGNEYKDKERIFIEIFADTTIDDVIAYWKNIESKQKNSIGYKKGRRRTLVYLKRDINIYKLKKIDGLEYKEIREIIKDQPTCKKLYTDDLSKIVAKISKKIAEA